MRAEPPECADAYVLLAEGDVGDDDGSKERGQNWLFQAHSCQYHVGAIKSPSE